MVASASRVTKTRGSLVELKRNLSISILDKSGSEDGRISYIKTIIAGCKFAFISVYAPSQYELGFFPSLTATLLQLRGFSLILGADMNCFVNLKLDKSVPRATYCIRASTEFKNFLSALSLTDLYRTINPTSRQYTFY